MIASWKLRPYFQSHSIDVLTNFPLKQVLQKLDATGKLITWAAKFGRFAINCKGRSEIKVQTLPDFIVEPNQKEIGIFFVDGSSGESGAGARIILACPKGYKLNYSLRVVSKEITSVSKCEALLPGIQFAGEMHAQRIELKIDWELVVNRDNGKFVATRDNTLHERCIKKWAWNGNVKI